MDLSPRRCVWVKPRCRAKGQRTMMPRSPIRLGQHVIDQLARCGCQHPSSGRRFSRCGGTAYAKTEQGDCKPRTSNLGVKYANGEGVPEARRRSRCGAYRLARTRHRVTPPRTFNLAAHVRRPSGEAFRCVWCPLIVRRAGLRRRRSVQKRSFSSGHVVGNGDGEISCPRTDAEAECGGTALIANTPGNRVSNPNIKHKAAAIHRCVNVRQNYRVKCHTKYDSIYTCVMPGELRTSLPSRE